MKVKTKIIVAIWSLMISTSIFGQFSQQSKIISPDRGSRDEFGTAVDIRGDFAISGTSRYNIAAGAAYIYAINRDGQWSHYQTLIPDDTQEMAEFGGAAKITEDYIVVASGRADIGTTIRAGALYVYDFNGSTWDFNTKLIASDYSADAKLGMNNTTIDAEGNTIVSGAPADGGWIGSVYVFERIEGVWTEVQKIENPANTNDTFGIAVAISGDTMVIGANESEDLKGTAYIYSKDINGLWNMDQQISASDGATGDFFGSSVSINGETIVVGAYGSDRVRGAAYVYQKDISGTWTETQKLVASTQTIDAHFGWQCEIKDNMIVVSAPHAYASTQGEIFVFQEESGEWVETQTLQGNDTAAEDFYGWSVSLYEDQIMVGAPWEDEDETGGNPVDRAGSAYIFKNPTLKTSDFHIKEADLVCYPNPTEEIVNIESSIKSIHNIKVIGITGILLNEYNGVNTMDFNLNLQDYSNGIYMINVEFEDGSKSIQKVIKQ